MSTPTPNKLTLVAAGVFAVTNPKKGKTWGTSSPEEQQPSFETAQFLLSHIFGADVNKVDQPKLAAVLEGKGLIGKDCNANTVVSVFVNITSALG